MANPGLSEQSEKEQTKIQSLAFFLNVFICAVLSFCLIFVYKNNSYSRRSLVLDNTINPNMDSAASMARLPLLGVTKVDAIIELRQSGIEFKNADDLDKVKGIGPKTVENIRPYLKFGTK
jgi:competence ComEA-like helix-hairpin-helix protein